MFGYYGSGEGRGESHLLFPIPLNRVGVAEVKS